MPTPTVPAFFTTVINVSGVTRSYGFLGKHGMELAANAQFTEPGNLVSKVAQKNRRSFNALERSVQGYTDDAGNVHAPTLAIIKTPDVFLHDSTSYATKSLTLTGGTLGSADPGWGPTESALTGSFTAITTPTTNPVSTATITFSQVVTGFAVNDLTLTRGGTPVILAGVTLTTSDHKVYTVNGLSSLTGTSGTYVLKVPYATSGITDVDGNPQAADISVTWVHS